MMKIFGKLIRGIFIGILSVLLILNIWQLISHYILHQNPPSVCGFSSVIVLSGSMEPTFSAGDLLIIREQESYQTGEIVTFEDGGVLTTHRIVEEMPDGFTTRGDCNNVKDQEKVTAEQVRGAYLIRIPRAGIVLFISAFADRTTDAGSSGMLLWLPDVINDMISHRKGCAD